MEGEPSAKRAKTEAPPAKPEGESVVERVRNILPKACALDDLLGSVERVREKQEWLLQSLRETGLLSGPNPSPANPPLHTPHPPSLHSPLLHTHHECMADAKNVDMALIADTDAGKHMQLVWSMHADGS